MLRGAPSSSFVGDALRELLGDVSSGVSELSVITSLADGCRTSSHDELDPEDIYRSAHAWRS